MYLCGKIHRWCKRVSSLAGLCGIYDRNKTNDLQGSDNILYAVTDPEGLDEPDEFSKSWRLVAHIQISFRAIIHVDNLMCSKLCTILCNFTIKSAIMCYSMHCYF